MANLRINWRFDPTIVMYLVIVDKLSAHYRDAITARPTEKFAAFVHGEVMKYVIDGKAPPEQIQTAIMNVADDMMADREVTMRAGDYISLMNYAKEMKML